MEGEVENQYKILIDSKQNIGLRYQAVFQLKNINTEAAILSMVKAYPHL
jgi:HEAT repeat protein